MENWQLALTIISAMLVGVLIPAVVQFTSTMRRVNALVRANEGDVRRTLVHVSEITAHLNKVGKAVETNTKQIESFFETLRDITEGISRMRKTVQTASIIGSAIAPAIVAAVRAKAAHAAGTAAGAAAAASAARATVGGTGGTGTIDGKQSEIKQAIRRGQAMNGARIEEENRK